MAARNVGRMWSVLVVVALGLGAVAPVPPLIEAIKRGDASAARGLLQQGADANSAEADGTTALHWAARRDDSDAVALLIAAGANVRAVNRYGVTPLFLALENGNAEIVARFLSAGANPNATLSGGETALMTAARTGNAEVIRALLAQGADPNARESTRGQTALMWAAAENNEAAVRALIEAGADLNARSHGPVVDAQINDTASRLNSFSRFYSREGRIDSFTPILFAAWAGQFDAARALLKAGANANDAAEDGTSALVIAAANAHWNVAALLLDSGADPNAMAQGWSALHQVARWRSLEYGRLPIPIPTGTLSHLDLAEKLIKAGADVNARIKKRLESTTMDRGSFVQIGATPLLLAAKGFDAGLMRLLLAHGADPGAKNALGSTLLMVAAGCETSNPGSDSGSPEDALTAVKVALELGAEVNAVNARGDTPLHGAANIGAEAIVQLLVEKGARLDLKNKTGLTPLGVAHLTVSGDGFHSQPSTAALLRRMMEERGLPIEVKTEEDYRAERETSGRRGRGFDPDVDDPDVPRPGREKR